MKTMKHHISFLIIISSLLFVGCGKSSSPNSTSPADSTSGGLAMQQTSSKPQSKCPYTNSISEKLYCEAQEEEQNKILEAIEKLPAGDPATPESSYRVLETMQDVAFLEAALPMVGDQISGSGLATSTFAQVAQMAFNKYSNERDTFKRQDLLASLTPQIQQGIDAAKNRRYLILDLDISSLGQHHYDPQSKGFPFNLGNHRSITISSAQVVDSRLETQSANYRVLLLNSASLPQVITVADEETARRIESKITSGKGGNVVIRLYCYARATKSLANNIILTDVMREQLIESK